MPMLRNQIAKKERAWVGSAAWACSFEFKTLRLHRVSSVQITVIHTEPSYWLNVGCWISSALIHVKFCVRLVFPTCVALSSLTKIWLSQKHFCWHSRGAQQLGLTPPTAAERGWKWSTLSLSSKKAPLPHVLHSLLTKTLLRARKVLRTFKENGSRLRWFPKSMTPQFKNLWGPKHLELLRRENSLEQEQEKRRQYHRWQKQTHKVLSISSKWKPSNKNSQDDFSCGECSNENRTKMLTKNGWSLIWWRSEVTCF